MAKTKSYVRLQLAALAAATAIAACSPTSAEPRIPSVAMDVAPPRPSAIDAFVREQVDRFHRPGVAVAVTKNSAVVWRRAYGLADVEAGAPITDDTVFPVCSLSKPVLLVAVMQVVERLAREQRTSLAAILDENVEELLSPPGGEPLRVRHPLFPDTPISLRMILTHVSGIRDHYSLAPHHVAVSPAAYTPVGIPDLGAALRDYLTPEGRYFDLQNFHEEAPGAKEVYSSVASSIAALVVIAQEGMSFEEYCNARIFAPLGMRDTAWRLAELAQRAKAPLALALPYQWRQNGSAPPSNARVSPLIWEHTFFPSASLRSTASDYARFVAALAGDGGHTALLEDATFREIARIQRPDVGPDRGLILAWRTRAGIRVLGHSGQNDGYRSDMFFTPSGGSLDGNVWGVVILTNGDHIIAEHTISDSIVGAHAAGNHAVSNETLESVIGSEILRLAMRGRFES